MSIGLLLPDVLGTYSDSGNATVLAQRLRWRGFAARVLRCPADEPPPCLCDLYVLGGGEDTAQLYAARWLREHPAARWLREHPALRQALATTSVTLAVCAGMQILGRWVTGRDGVRYPGADVLDLSTEPRRRRATGELVIDCALPGVGLLSGFENHAGATTLGDGVAALGQVISGVGNGHRTGRAKPVEGVVTDRVVGTYMHGPVLARNPALADHLLTQALGSPLPELEELPDQAALRATYLTPAHRRIRRWPLRSRHGRTP